MKTGGIRQLAGRISFALKGGVLFCALLSHFLALSAHAAPDATPAAPQRPAASVANDGFNDGIDRSDPNFVTASLLWIGPGKEFFGCAGHSSIRLECPTFNLDYCFSCESESIKDNFFRFIMGDLKTGMFAIPTADFLKTYAQLGRSATQYKLNLPPEVKQRLWKILDDEVAAGRCLPYDYIKYCCVQTMLQPLLKAIPPDQLSLSPWSEIYKLTRRERLAIELDWCKWTGAFLELIAGVEVDRDVSNVEKVILSEDFVELLRGATINGKPIIDDEGVIVQPIQTPLKRTVFTPTMVAVVVLLVSLVNFFTRISLVDWLFLAFQSLIGLFLFHLLFFSSLPATGWNWLFVPFNPFPLIFWRWRKKWALWFASVLLLWEGFMILHPHRLTGSAYLVLVVAFVLMYVRIGCPWRVSRHGVARVGLCSGRDASTMRPPTV